MSHDFGCELFQSVTGFLKVDAVAADEKMLETHIMSAADIVDDRFRTSGEGEPAAVASFLFGADTAVNRQQCTGDALWIAPCRFKAIPRLL